jgi:hypothetical protein
MVAPIKKPIPKKPTPKSPAPKKSTKPIKKPIEAPKKDMSTDVDYDPAVDGDGIIKTNKRGKIRTCVPFEEARKFVQDEAIPSRRKYEEWWMRHKPKDIPKYPNRAYQKEFISWNDFLGNNNDFLGHVTYTWLPYEEAKSIVHTLNIGSYEEWLAFCKTDRMIPNIPKRPDLQYHEWRTWGTWLGKNSVARLDAIHKSLSSQDHSFIYYIIQEQGAPNNIVSVGVNKNGILDLKSQWERRRFHIHRVYWVSLEDEQFCKEVTDALSSSYFEDESIRLVPNLWELFYYLEQRLTRVDLTKVSELERKRSLAPTKQDTLIRQVEQEEDSLEHIQPSELDNLGIEVF